jgi:hypothetical protein
MMDQIKRQQTVAAATHYWGNCLGLRVVNPAGRARCRLKNSSSQDCGEQLNSQPTYCNGKLRQYVAVIALCRLVYGGTFRASRW